MSPATHLPSANEIASRSAARIAKGQARNGDQILPDVRMTADELAVGVPAWGRETLPAWVEPYVGRRGMYEPWNAKQGILAPRVEGLDRWQANRFISFRPETAEFLYGSYTATPQYVSGTFPNLEAAVQPYRSLATETEKAVAVLTKVLPALRHPVAPPAGPMVGTGRNLSDEAIFLSGCAWCNEQARAFIAMCHILGVPARIIHLFYADNVTGHTVAEFYADGRWAMADASYLVVFPDGQGKLMSAAECHLQQNRPLIDAAYRSRYQQIAAMSAADLGGAEKAAAFRARLDTAWHEPANLDWFAVINHFTPR
jgi:hypothetical protein